MSLTINRTRSPKYPNYSLRTAVQRVGKIHTADRRNVIERINAAGHMGYTSLSGPAEKAIGTLVQFGLLDIVDKGRVRVSQLAVDVLHPDSEAQRKSALLKAAYHPDIFKSLKERFPEGVSESSLKSYLVRENFMDRAIVPITKAYSETAAFLEQSGAIDSGGDAASGASESEFEDEEIEDMEPMQNSPVTPRRVEMPTAMPAGVENDIKIMLDGDHLRVSAVVDIKGAKRLLKALKANIALLEDDEDDDQDDIA